MAENVPHKQRNYHNANESASYRGRKWRIFHFPALIFAFFPCEPGQPKCKSKRKVKKIIVENKMASSAILVCLLALGAQIRVHNLQPISELLLSSFSNRGQVQTVYMKMSFVCIRKKTHFHMNGFALGLGLKKRLRTTRKWAIGSALASGEPP